METYIRRFDFIFNPFQKNSNQIYLENSNYKELELNLEFVLDNKGIALITGDPGCGKTSAIRHFVEKLPRNLYKPIYICLSTLTVREFLQELASKLGLEPTFRKSILVKSIKEQISNLNDIKKINPIIIIDEANYLSNGILNDLKMIFNFEMDSKNKATLILVGLPSLLNTLELKIHQPFNQRIMAKVNFEQLNQAESKEYIETKIMKAGADIKIFDENAINGVINGSGGLPRVIDKIIDKALMIANKMEENTINLELIKKVVSTL